jgi:hypothetical protein
MIDFDHIKTLVNYSSCPGHDAIQSGPLGSR